MHEWSHPKWGTNWIVTVPCVDAYHDHAMVRWCECEFGYVDKGVLRAYHSQDFWFRSESQALQFWLAWAP